MKYKIGDLVIKMSGGNKMTVDSFDTQAKSYKCFWFVNSSLFQDSFSEEKILSIPEYRLHLKCEERDDKINNIFKE